MEKLRQIRRLLLDGSARILLMRPEHAQPFVTLSLNMRGSGQLADADTLKAACMFARGDDESGPKRPYYAGPLVFPGAKAGKAVAVVSMKGVALYDVEWQPYAFSSLLLSQTIKALAANPEIGTIVLDVNSPGGITTGVREAGDAVFEARKTTKVVAVVNPLCASAAYWIASQASEIIAVPSADIGSIGVYMTHCDLSGMLAQSGIKPTFIFAGEHKVEANAYEPLSPEAKAYLQGEVDSTYADFLETVARGRGVSVADVRENFGKGRVFSAPEAKRIGMIDRVDTLDSAFARHGISFGSVQGQRRAEAERLDESADGDGGTKAESSATISDDVALVDQADAAETPAPQDGAAGDGGTVLQDGSEARARRLALLRNT